MRTRSLRLISGLLLATLARMAAAEDWPGWRGPRGDGTSQESQVPLRWNGTSGDHVRWKTRLPGTGHSSPIVWQQSIFLTACDENSGARLLLKVDTATGAIQWQTEVLKAPLEKRHPLNNFASGTPLTDGQRVYVTFLEPDFSSETEATPGNLVVAAYDFAGHQLWTVKPGRFSSVHGFCSSPVLFENLVIVNGDHDGDGYLVALDRESGATVWKQPRPHNTRSYVTPIIRQIGDRTQMVLSGSKCVTSYNPKDGSLHWIIEGPTEQFVASLVYNGSLLFLTAGFPERHILAIRPDGRGDVTDTHIVWRTTKACSYVPSPAVVDKYFLVAADNGIASCYEADSGRLLWLERLGKQYSASLLVANGLVYFLDDDGIAKVVRPGKQLEVVAENPLGEPCRASPAISGGQIYLRGIEHLFSIGP